MKNYYLIFSLIFGVIILVAIVKAICAYYQTRDGETFSRPEPVFTVRDFSESAETSDDSSESVEASDDYTEPVEASDVSEEQVESFDDTADSIETGDDPAEPEVPSNGNSERIGTARRSAELTTIGQVNYYANTRHRQADNWFQFEYRKEDGEWLVYILRMPNLRGRDPGAHETHRYTDGESYWICYDPQPRRLRDAQTITRAWADRELEYIATGVLFEDQRW